MAAVRVAKLRDVNGITRLARESITKAYNFYPPDIKRQLTARNSRSSLAKTILLKRRLILAAIYDGKILGYLIGQPNTDGIALVYSLYVSDDHRTKGLGRLLLNDFEARLGGGVKKIMVWTEIAPDYYRKLGWAEEAKLSDHWWGQDWVIFSKSLKT